MLFYSLCCFPGQQRIRLIDSLQFLSGLKYSAVPKIGPYSNIKLFCLTPKTRISISKEKVQISQYSPNLGSYSFNNIQENPILSFTTVRTRKQKFHNRSPMNLFLIVCQLFHQQYRRKLCEIKTTKFATFPLTKRLQSLFYNFF